MDWADELAAQVRDRGPQVVNDSKTPSGTVHVGSLRGPVILDTITRALRANGIETTLLYGVDDLDPMDAQALLTPDAVEHEMGRPLAHVPDQAGDGHASYARHHAQVFIDVFAGLGIHPDRYYWMSEIYPTGAMDPYLRIALDKAAEVREIYRRVANVQHPDAWHPAGRHLPELRQGRHDDRDPVGRRAGLLRVPRTPRRVGEGLRRRPAGSRRSAATPSCPGTSSGPPSGRYFGVTIEPCGKDLSTAGGSRDRSDAIAREIFEREPPLNVPYEFLNIGGKKMSTSKGRGAAAHTIAEVIPPEQLRFLFLRPKPNHAIEFDPDGTDQIPRLFDEFDKFAAATAGREVKGELPPGYEATFRYSLLDPASDVAAEAAAFRPAFSHLALLAQVPGVDVAARVEAEKGSALDRSRDARSSTSASPRPAAGSTPTRPSAPWSRSRRPCLPRPRTSTRRTGRSWRRSPTRPRTPASRPATPGRTRSSGRPGRPGSRRRPPSPRSTSRSWADRTARARAGCWPAWRRRS